MYRAACWIRVYDRVDPMDPVTNHAFGLESLGSEPVLLVGIEDHTGTQLNVNIVGLGMVILIGCLVLARR